MAKTARGTVGTTAPDTRPMMARGSERIEVPRRGRRQGEARRAQALSVARVPRRLREADDGGSTLARRAASKPRPQDVDRHVGARMRDRRVLLGMTQQQLAELIGVTFQQAHKYEKGINRMTAGRLYRIARALGVQVGYFYEELPNAGGAAPSPNQRMLLELARNFLGIRDRRHQGAVVSFARALAESESGK